MNKVAGNNYGSMVARDHVVKQSQHQDQSAFEDILAEEWIPHQYYEDYTMPCPLGYPSPNRAPSPVEELWVRPPTPYPPAKRPRQMPDEEVDLLDEEEEENNAAPVRSRRQSDVCAPCCNSFD